MGGGAAGDGRPGAGGGGGARGGGGAPRGGGGAPRGGGGGSPPVLRVEAIGAPVFCSQGFHREESVPGRRLFGFKRQGRRTLSFGIPTPAKMPASCGAPPAPGLALAPSSSSSVWPALGRVGGFGAEAAGADPSLTTPAPWTTVLSTVWTCLRPFPFWICCSRAESMVRS